MTTAALPEISEISNWPLKRARFLFKERRENVHLNDIPLSATQNYGVIWQDRYQKISGNRVTVALSGLDNLQHVCRGDFVISLRTFQGGIEYAYDEGCISPAYTVLVSTEEVHHPYFRYALKSSIFLSVLRTAARGIRDGKSINYRDFADLLIPAPPLGSTKVSGRTSRP